MSVLTWNVQGLSEDMLVDVVHQLRAEGHSWDAICFQEISRPRQVDQPLELEGHELYFGGGVSQRCSAVSISSRWASSIVQVLCPTSLTVGVRLKIEISSLMLLALICHTAAMTIVFF